LPSLERLHQYFNNEPFALLAIDVQEKKNVVLRYVRSKSLSFHNLLDTEGEVTALYGVRSHPMKFIIDTDGNLIGVAWGYRDWDTDKMKSLIEVLINSKR
jgi:thioredoxin-related protein